jgi:hypothetical protein
VIDRLQSWFDGGDWFALGLGMLSLVAAVWALVRQGRIDRDNLKLQSDNLALQRRMAEIEEARRDEELARTQEADVRVYLRTVLSQNRRSYDTVLTIENRGGAAAENVTLDDFRSGAMDNAVIVPDLPYPIPAILPGDRVTHTSFISMGAGDVFRATVSWNDPRGPQSQDFTVTRERH